MREAKPLSDESSAGHSAAPRRQFVQPRVAQMIADVLRTRIVDGELPDGSLLPKQDDLIAEFQVSRPSFREALRILENEGLLSVRRGSVGGAQVHAPTPENAARTLGLVLQARQVELDDLADALAVIEPACAAHCAMSPDRHVALVPKLRELNARSQAIGADDAVGAAQIAAEFHDAIITGCGNDTLMIVVGALERLWALHEHAWADSSSEAGGEPQPGLRESVLEAHEAITDAIDAGDPVTAHQFAALHLATTQPQVLDHRQSQRIYITTPETGARRTPPIVPGLR
jgi:DNA-binding FadR family transcriptional regulator